MIVSLLQRILSQLKELAGNIGGAIKNILYDSYMTEEQLLAKLVENPDIDMNGFFYNSDIGEYCSFSGLYMSKIVSGEEVHYGYCEIRGVHDSEYLVDYRIDWEDSTSWYKVDMVTHNDLISYTKLGIVGDAYDSTKTYNAGDYCIYHNVNYKKLGASEYGVTPTDDGVHWKAVNVNNEVSELNSNLKWKKMGSVTGKTNFTFTKEFEELYISAKSSASTVTFNANVLYAELSASNKQYEAGCGHASGFSGMEFYVSTSKFLLNWFFVGNGDYTTTTTVDIYYR